MIENLAEREREFYWLPLVGSSTGDQTCNLGMCPDWESNPQHFGVWNNTPTN